ncbi:uncharacterized protein, partial [Penaeus vannamei]|uniref:uncharacterized protein n=1 Tax=Penaeus vannamei TaxID=6689 RepID=UPI00387F423E
MYSTYIALFFVDLSDLVSPSDLACYFPSTSDQFLELPESPVRRHSSSEEERRVATLERDDRGRPHDKEKKGHRSAWGKVKNIIPAPSQVKSMISTRRDSVRKKSSSAGHRKSTTERPDVSAGVAVEVSAASDPEDYEVDYEGLVGEAVDPGGA